MSAIGGIACQLHPQQSRHHRLRLSRIGAGVLVPVATEHSPTLTPVQPEEQTGKQHHEGTEPCGEVIENVIGTGGKASEVGVRLIDVADHGVHRIHRLVGDTERRTAEEEEEEWCHDAVGGILRHRLHRSLGDPLGGETLRIPPDDHRDRTARLREIPVEERLLHLASLRHKRVRRQHLPAEDALHCQSCYRMYGCGEENHESTESPAYQHDDEPEQQPGSVSLPRRLPVPSQPPLQPTDQPPHTDDRMGHPSWIAEAEVEEEADDDREEVIHPGSQ